MRKRDGYENERKKRVEKTTRGLSCENRRGFLLSFSVFSGIKQKNDESDAENVFFFHTSHKKHDNIKKIEI